MAELKQNEKRTLERLFDMGGGYVLYPHFSNRTLAEFVQDTVRRDLYDPKYASGGESKANRMRTFWALESDALVATVVQGLIDFMLAENIAHEEADLLGARAIVARLNATADVSDLDVLDELGEARTFEKVAAAARQSIEQNDPASGLDRLHTFLTKYLRSLCKQVGIETDKKVPLHSLMGQYRNSLRTTGNLEAGMTDTILKANLEVLERFNGVRNDQSLAHDNPELNYEEALLIFGHVTALIRFLRRLEKKLAATAATPSA